MTEPTDAETETVQTTIDTFEGETVDEGQIDEGDELEIRYCSEQQKMLRTDTFTVEDYMTDASGAVEFLEISRDGTTYEVYPSGAENDGAMICGRDARGKIYDLGRLDQITITEEAETDDEQSAQCGQSEQSEPCARSDGGRRVMADGGRDAALIEDDGSGRAYRAAETVFEGDTATIKFDNQHDGRFSDVNEITGTVEHVDHAPLGAGVVVLIVEGDERRATVTRRGDVSVRKTDQAVARAKAVGRVLSTEVVEICTDGGQQVPGVGDRVTLKYTIRGGPRHGEDGRLTGEITEVGTDFTFEWGLRSKSTARVQADGTAYAVYEGELDDKFGTDVSVLEGWGETGVETVEHSAAAIVAAHGTDGDAPDLDDALCGLQAAVAYANQHGIEGIADDAAQLYQRLAVAAPDDDWGDQHE